MLRNSTCVVEPHGLSRPLVVAGVVENRRYSRFQSVLSQLAVTSTLMTIPSVREMLTSHAGNSRADGRSGVMQAVSDTTRSTTDFIIATMLVTCLARRNCSWLLQRKRRFS